MGIGDELMMAGEARRLAGDSTRRYLMTGKHGEPRWHFVWEGNRHVAAPGQPHDGEIGFINGTRPYIERLTPERYFFREYSPAQAFLRLSAQGAVFSRLAAGGVVFNPMIKRKASPNKAWGLDRWRALIAENRDVRWIQLMEPGAPRLRGAEHLATPNFFDAVGAIRGAAAAVVSEGALHHVAAAVGTPAVVIRGGFISPRVTGYPGQRDLYVQDERYPFGCGMRTPCAHCADAMAAIKPDMVMAVLRSVLTEERANAMQEVTT